MNNQLKPDQHISGFRIISVESLNEYQGTGIEAVHEKTGCRIYHVLRDDRENLFAFAFPTPPSDSSGVAHILEHSVLCGSERFPVKDPFVELMKGSLQTFLNAMTFPDRTIYPASSINEKDFYNLMQVYGDAVFFPLLERGAFLQEGRRFVPNDSGLEVTGVVFNEMQGNYSSPDSLAGEWSYRPLFPDSVYAHDSGGDPLAIPDLSYDNFLEFHRTCYHPTNTRIFLYGDIPTEKHLDFLNREFLSRFSGMGPELTIPAPSALQVPVHEEKTFPLGEQEDESKRTTLLMSWRFDDSVEPTDRIALEVLSEILLSNAGSPLRRALVESGLGEDLSPVSGLELDLMVPVFTVGLRGSEGDRMPEMKKLIERTLRQLADEGIDVKTRTGALRRVAFRAQEMDGRGGPFGLRLMKRLMRGWIYGAEPGRAVSLRPWFEDLENRLVENPDFFESLIARLFLANQSVGTVVLKPDKNYHEKRKKELRQTIDRIGSEQGQHEGENSVRENLRCFQEFQARQDSREALASIPRLSVDELPAEVQTIDTQEEKLAGNVPAYLHHEYTNKIVYIDFAFSLDGMKQEELILLPLLGRVIARSGCSGMSYEQALREMALYTGGFGAQLDADEIVGNPGSTASMMLFRIKALSETLEAGLNQAGSMMLETDLSDYTHLKDLVYEFRNDAVSSIIPSGHALVGVEAARSFSPAADLEALWHGISQMLFLKELADRPIEEIAELLSSVQHRLMDRGRLEVQITAGNEEMPGACKAVESFIDRFSGKGSSAGKGRGEPDIFESGVLERFPQSGGGAAFEIPAAVGYAASAIPSARFGSRDHPAEAVLSHILKTGPLWREIRMNRGAYGAFTIPHALEGIMGFATYRDPQAPGSPWVFRTVLEELASGGVEKDEFEQGIIGTVGLETRPYRASSIGFIGMRRRKLGITDELRRQKREAVLSISPEDIARAAGRLAEAFDQSMSALMASPEMFAQAENAEKGLLDPRGKPYRRIALPV
ncbi:MAG: insulinase family protein [Spirochaetales bacterium]|nr:insulinase family protein [Spirochaetales bacterium]MCF7937827.1 insulinase family protein [Spirochaetales bacterium]